MMSGLRDITQVGYEALDREVMASSFLGRKELFESEAFPEASDKKVSWTDDLIFHYCRLDIAPPPSGSKCLLKGC